MLKKPESTTRGKFLKVHLFDAPCCCGKAPTVRGDAVGGLVGGSRPPGAFGNRPCIFQEPSWSPGGGSWVWVGVQETEEILIPVALEYQKMER